MKIIANMTSPTISHLARISSTVMDRKLDLISQSVTSMDIQRSPGMAGRLPNVAFTSNAHTIEAISGGFASTLSCPVESLDDQSTRLVLTDTRRRTTTFMRTLWRKSQVAGYLFASVRVDSKSKRKTIEGLSDSHGYDQLDQREDETSYTITPADWLICLGFQRGLRLKLLSSSTQGWKATLETVRTVPDDSLIFDLCKDGDVIGVKRLLSKGHASVRDTNSRGYTPLHVSFSHHRDRIMAKASRSIEMSDDCY